MSATQHHPEHETLLAYAAGSLPTALALVVGCHIESCAECAAVTDAAESAGGALLDQGRAVALSERARAAVLARLDEQQNETSDVRRVESTPPSSVPAKLQRLIGTGDLSNLRWRRVSPGLERVQLPCGEGNAMLMRIAGDAAMPVHSHQGSELTLILEGGYSDALGHFGPGDVADLDGSVEHQPHADPEGCICLAGLDAPLRFRDWLPRLFQRFTGM